MIILENTSFRMSSHKLEMETSRYNGLLVQLEKTDCVNSAIKM